MVLEESPDHILTTKYEGIFAESGGLALKRDMQEKRCKTTGETVATEDATSRTETFMPISLRTICIRFIAVNIEHVDSLVGFPELVGKALFLEVEKGGNLTLNKPQCGVIMQLFLDAYHAAVLEHLTLRSAHLLINQHLDLWLRFTHLQLLDLGGCRLGDEHDMLSFVGQLQCLTCLSFQDNCLSDAGMRKLTGPSRVFGRGPSNLQILDISGNPLLTNGVVRYLLHFKMLEILDLSGTNVSKRGIKQLERSLLVVDESATRDVEKTFCGVCVGWAADTVTRWTDQLLSGPSEDSNNKSTVAKFYGHSKHRIALAQTLTICKPSHRHPVMCLRKCKQKCGLQLEQSHSTRSVSDGHRSDAARRKQHDLSEEDLALMASYII